MTEAENYADDGSVWGVVGDVLEDIMEQQVPGSIVLLIVGCLVVPWIYKGVMAYFAHRRG